MRSYLLLFLSTCILLFALPKNNSIYGFAAQANQVKKSCRFTKGPFKKKCATKCIRHQSHSEKQKNATSVPTECGQQVFGIVNALHLEPVLHYPGKRTNRLPHIRSHLSPDLENDPEPPRFA